MSTSPCDCHEPGEVEVNLGIGELFASAAESLTVIGAFGETPTAPGAGLIEMTLSAVGTAVVVVVEGGKVVDGVLEPIVVSPAIGDE